MGQVAIYCEDEIESKMIKAEKFAHLSKSKWIARLIHEKMANEWPQSVVDLAESWDDFPSLEDIRKSPAADAKRENF